MPYYALKILLSATVLVAISEIAKRSSALAALLASLPLTSLLAFVWMQLEVSPPASIAELSGQIFWLVLPSLLLFVLLPWLLRHGFGFWAALGLASAATVLAYGLMLLVLRRFGVVI
jgi:hypothetical protein